MKIMEWDEYIHSQQETYLDEENAADTEIVWENEDYMICAHKRLHVREDQDHYFCGKDEDFAIVSQLDLEWLVYDCTLADLINYYNE